MAKQINHWLASIIAGVALGIWKSVLEAHNPKYLFNIGCSTWQDFYFVLVPANIAMTTASILVVLLTIALAAKLFARLTKK